MTRTDPAERAKKAEQLAGCLKAVREKAPLIQAITNFVTVNDCANIILAAGASPTMAHDIREAGEIAAKADALVLNMGRWQRRKLWWPPAWPQPEPDGR